MFYQQLFSFAVGLYTGLNLFATNTDVVLCVTLLLGILVGAAASKLNMYDRRRQAAVYNPKILQRQHPAVKSANTSTTDEGSSSIVPEIAWLSLDDVDGGVTDVPDQGRATCPFQISSYDNIAAGVCSPLQTNTLQIPFVAQGGFNATREPSPDSHFQAVVVIDEDIDLVNHPSDTAGMAETNHSESLATSQPTASPHLEKSESAPRRS